MSIFSGATTIHEIDLEDGSIGRQLRRGVTIGVPAVYLVVLAVALLGGASLGSALALAALPGFVAGPYLGSLLALSILEERRHLADVATLLQGPARETPVPHAA